MSAAVVALVVSIGTSVFWIGWFFGSLKGKLDRTRAHLRDPLPGGHGTAARRDAVSVGGAYREAGAEMSGVVVSQRRITFETVVATANTIGSTAGIGPWAWASAYRSAIALKRTVRDVRTDRSIRVFVSCVCNCGRNK